MQVAHRIDLEYIGEDWHHEHVRYESDRVVLEVLQEIHRAHYHRQDVNSEHDDASEAQRAKVGLVLVHPIAVGGIVLGHADRHVGVEAALGQEVSDTQDR